MAATIIHSGAEQESSRDQQPDRGRPARSSIPLEEGASSLPRKKTKRRARRPRSQAKHLLRRPRSARGKVGYVVRIDPGRILPAALVVIRHAVLRERDHAVERAGT